MQRISPYPEGSSERDRWILARRPPRTTLDPFRPYAFFVEDECSHFGEVVKVATIFLTNRECPWRCLMCDLWKNTLTAPVPTGAIAGQIDYALGQLPAARQIKLYNSGSFFDTQAVPLIDHAAVADRVSGFERVIVESHPALVGEACFSFQPKLCGRLEVAMGLETAHPGILERLNKRMTLDQFAAAAEKLKNHGIAMRAFILVKPPFMLEDEALEWAERSLDFAFDCGATAATLIPTRAGNGALDQLSATGDFAPPKLAIVEAAAAYGLALRRGRLFVDLWDAKGDDACTHCFELRIDRLRAMNLAQILLPAVDCEVCRSAR